MKTLRRKTFEESVYNDATKGEGWCQVEANYYAAGIGTVRVITDEYEGVAILHPEVAKRLLEVLPRAIAFAEGRENG